MIETIDIIKADESVICAQQRDDGLIEVITRDKSDRLTYTESFTVYSNKLKNGKLHVVQTGAHGDIIPEMYKYNKNISTWLHSLKTLRKYKKRTNA